ncbi:DUF167 domain-containing protein [Crassaminicella profunda]|uniref:DUF167 domain-containing protein n=1 Tax=Crassaminicella profunda TaxID=1286698 RepID=UPI001CA6B985|nr:DUF167 domain-containing protein [Crassaminicella profunda]QZY53692.1 DUF167 domain-containing protein [Crassaminicella profunda]
MDQTIIAHYKKLLEKEKTITLKIKVSPKMSKTEFKKILDDDTLKLNIKSAPEKGKANKEIIHYLSKLFGISKKDISIISGETAPLKLIKLSKNSYI